MTVKAKSGKSKTVKLVNRMKCKYYVPQTLERGILRNNEGGDFAKNQSRAGKTTGLLPNESVVIKKDNFDLYYKGSKAFRALIDTKMLDVNGKGIFHDGMLSNPSKPEVPVDLLVEDNRVDIVSK